jgi:hypothetical protein
MTMVSALLVIHESDTPGILSLVACPGMYQPRSRRQLRGRPIDRPATGRQWHGKFRITRNQWRGAARCSTGLEHRGHGTADHAEDRRSVVIELTGMTWPPVCLR